MTYKIRNRSGNVIITTRSLKKVTNFLNITADEVNTAIKQRLTIQNRYTIDGIPDIKDTDTLEQTTAKMSDEGYGVNYGKYQVDKAKGVI